MTNTEQNRSHTTDESLQDDDRSTAKTPINRRTCLKLAGLAATSLAGCAGNGGPTTGGAAAGFGYGGSPAVTEQVAATDVTEIAELGSVARSVRTIDFDAPLSTTLAPGASDLFAFQATDATDLTISYKSTGEAGLTALGFFDPEGELVSQAYARPNVPVYIPESISTAGTHYVQVLDLSRGGGAYDLNLSTEYTTTQSQSPYEGTVASIPGRIQAQNFDVGGEGMGYHDTSSGNVYGLNVRDTDVDIRKTGDESGSYNIGYFQSGEWLEYTTDVTAGAYDVSVRVSSPFSGGKLRLTLGDQTLGTVEVPNTGDWTTWETVTLSDVSIDLDEQTALRVEALDSGIELNWIEFDALDTQGPHGGSPVTIPGRFEAENYDLGGEGTAYHDTSTGNEYDTSYRDGDVDIRETQDSSGTYNVGYFQDGEWLEYTADVSPGTYDLGVRVATTRSDRQLKFSLDGQELATVDVPNTGGWTTWELAVVENVSIDADGEHVLRVEAIGSGIDFNYAEFKEVDTESSNLPALPGRIQAEDYDQGGEGVAYHDTSAGNEYDTSYRDGDVDIRETQDVSGGYNVGYFQDGEWLQYTAEIPAGTYDLSVRVATPRSGRQLAVSLDGTQVGTIDVPTTGDWTAWETATLRDVTVSSGGEHSIRVKAAGSGIDFNWFELLESGSTETETATPTETETATPTETETATPTETETATPTPTETATESGSTVDDFGEQGYGMGGYGGTQ
ncbi:carbohydrate-binding domain-containing protein [Haloarcula salina]|uniref:Carbohydrate-binding protein n=1 Tax=Haloarcula salina TaxID=1429914 RepID=A0AA41KID7_9EURY|nr:carbohydrate-binding domain-containing protein [Haloarcula salina]MBV0902741.1 carbohydrate-binding protein [Haloarcula salina]